MSHNSLKHTLIWAEKLFIKNKLYFGHGTVTAWDEAVFLASYVLDIDLYKNVLKEQELTQKQMNLFTKIALLRVAEKKPLPYLLKTAWFAGKKYYVDARVIIPRSPFAELINNKFRPWMKTKPKSILDLCTGSGCIAIACFHAFARKNSGINNIKIDASDISIAAINVAKKNLQLHNIKNKINLIKSDLFNNIPNYKYDLIVSNPPYVDQKTFDKLPMEFHFEPKKALVAGDGGLEIVIKILHNAHKFLSNKGILIIEVGVMWKKLIKLYPKVNFMWLEFANGGEGIFLLTKQQLDELMKKSRPENNSNK